MDDFQTVEFGVCGHVDLVNLYVLGLNGRWSRKGTVLMGFSVFRDNTQIFN